jgi:CobQ/CobB/MinD/ParA nucleotide binding domain protein
MAADTIISIIKPDIVSSRGLSLLTDTLSQVKPGKTIDAVIVNQYKRRKISDLTTELMRQDFNVLNTVIRDSSVIAESASIGKDIVEYANKSIGYDDFLAVTNELIKERLL